jgi:hypothetical protein
MVQAGHDLPYAALILQLVIVVGVTNRTRSPDVEFHYRATKSSRVLAMSGIPMHRRNWLQAGCDDFILKPFTIPTLWGRLSKLSA